MSWKYTGKDFLNFNNRVVPGEIDSLDAIAQIANEIKDRKEAERIRELSLGTAQFLFRKSNDEDDGC